MAKSEIEKFFQTMMIFGFRQKHASFVAADDEAEIEEAEGQLSIDMYQTDSDVVIKAPVAGVDPDDLDINVTEEFCIYKRKET